MISAYSTGEQRLIRILSVSDDDAVIAAISVEYDCQRTLTDCIRTIPVTRMEIKQETQDPMIQKVCGFLRHSWPPNLTGDLQQFKRRSGSLSIIDGCLMFADRVVVPTKLRQAVLRLLHSGHPGINRMKSIACSVVYWLNIDIEIERTVKRCIQCMEAQKNPPRIVDSHWTYPEQPWSRIHVDFAGPINSLSFLVVLDAHSK